MEATLVHQPHGEVLAQHGARLAALEDSFKSVDRKLDRLLFAILAFLVAAIIAILKKG